MQNAEFILVLLFINHCITVCRNKCKPTFASPCTCYMSINRPRRNRGFFQWTICYSSIAHWLESVSDTERCSQTKGFLPAIVNIQTGLSHSERRICVVAESIVTGFLMIEDSNNYKIAGCPPSVKGATVCVCVCWPQSRRWEQWSDALPLLTGSDWIHQREEAGSELSTGANIREIAHQPEATPFLKPQGPLEEIQKKIGLEDQEKQTCEGGGVS